MAIKQELLGKLAEIVGEDDVRADTAELYSYATDASIHRMMPDCVVRPESREEVSKIVKLANEYKVPIVPRGAGTALCGHAVPIEGGIVMSFLKMNKVLEVRPQDRYCIVQPGAICDDLNKVLKPYGFFFPPDPGSSHSCTVGGMVIANASGQRAIKYGATRDYVMGLEVVYPTGEIARTGTSTLKDASGLQLARLFAGSEGTLGLITEITLKIVLRPETTASCVAAFDTLEDASKCVSRIIETMTPARMELMDNVCINAVNTAQQMGLPDVEAMLLIGVDGHPATVKDEIKKVTEICKKGGAKDVTFTDDPKEEAKLWKGRKAMIPSLSTFKEGWVCVMLADDMSVPMSKIPEAAKAFRQIADKYGIYIPTYGHVADGNLHTKVIMDPKNKEHWEAVEKAVEEVYDVVFRLGGSTTGEHGSAITKAPMMQKERGKVNVDVMKSIKKALDPNNVMNPRKMMDWDDGFITHLRYNPGGKPKEINLKKWDHEMDICTYCGYCKVVCPTYEPLLWDSQSARGRLLLAYGVLQGEIDLDDSIAKALYSCTMCKDCYRRCPSKVQVPDIVKSARADLVDQGFAYATHKGVIDNIKKTGNIFGDEEVAPPLREGTLPLFIGCQYLSRPNQTKLWIRILGKLGIEVLVQDEICCGYPMEALGFTKDFAEHKKKLEKLLPQKEVITLCPTCTDYLREEYDKDAKHVLQVVAEKLPAKKLGGKVTYHDPCDLSRAAKVIDEPREIIKRLGVELVEMGRTKDQSMCCGGGGGILMSDADLSNEIAVRRIEQARATGADTLVTACATCEQVLKKGAMAVGQSGNGGMTVRNISDLLWKALK